MLGQEAPQKNLPQRALVYYSDGLRAERVQFKTDRRHEGHYAREPPIENECSESKVSRPSAADEGRAEMSHAALFAGLVFDEHDRPVEWTTVGDETFYVVDDDGFRRHVPAEEIDRAVLAELREQILSNRDAVAQGALQMMGADDLFTKAMIDSSLNNIDENFRKLMDTGLPEQARQWLGMLGFKIVVNYHGEVLRMESPGVAGADDGDH